MYALQIRVPQLSLSRPLGTQAVFSVSSARALMSLAFPGERKWRCAGEAPASCRRPSCVKCLPRVRRPLVLRGLLSRSPLFYLSQSSPGAGFGLLPLTYSFQPLSLTFGPLRNNIRYFTALERAHYFCFKL